jgi:excisionase family DNA binding protein
MSEQARQRWFSARQLARREKIGRDRIGAAIQRGDLRASRTGTRRYLILESDFDEWLARHVVSTAAHAERRVTELLDRESRKPAA